MKKLKNEALNRISVSEFKNIEKIPVLIVLDNIRSLNNVGSAFRTSDAFKIEKIYLCGITGTPPHRDIQKTALGATDSVDWEYFDDTLSLIHKLKQEGVTIASIEQAEKSVSLEKFNPQPGKRIACIFGNEVFGVDQQVVDASDMCLEIPQYGTKHSLNIAVSVGIVIWDLFQKISANNKT